jgi:hypothetical protein
VKLISPQLGFNNNVKHKGRVFHIQTEDSGIRRPHVITHLFADGGRILKTTKTSYAEHVESDSVVETVVAMMKEQHKAMFVALREGQFDHLFEVPTRPSMPPPAPGPVAHSSHTEPAFFAPEPPKAVPAPAAQVVSRTAVTTPELAAAGRPPLAPKLAPDLTALERAAATRPGPAQAPPVAAHAPPPRPPTPVPTAGRYAISRPASIFANTRPPEGASIFGEELISEKSLDEVILSYLADDLGAPTKK